MYCQIINISFFLDDKIIWNDKVKKWDRVEKTDEKDFRIRSLWEDSDVHGIEEFSLESRDNQIYRRNKDILVVENRWQESKILSPFFSCEDVGTLVLQVFYAHAVQKNIIQFHSSLISVNESVGLMFIGPSGIGKTTQAELWNKYRNAKIINGDIVFVQETMDVFYGWGTPWHGSSPYCENDCVPIKALIVLKQSEKNSIRKLNGFEKVAKVSGHVFYPRWVENGMELCLNTLNDLLTRIPVYELSCRPDEEAVRLTECVVFER